MTINIAAFRIMIYTVTHITAFSIMVYIVTISISDTQHNGPNWKAQPAVILAFLLFCCVFLWWVSSCWMSWRQVDQSMATPIYKTVNKISFFWPRHLTKNNSAKILGFNFGPRFFCPNSLFGQNNKPNHIIIILKAFLRKTIPALKKFQ